MKLTSEHASFYNRGPSPTPIPSPFPASGHVGPTYQGATQPITEDVGDRASCLARNTPPKTPRKKKKVSHHFNFSLHINDTWNFGQICNKFLIENNRNR